MILKALSFPGQLDLSGPEILGSQFQRAVFRRAMRTGDVLEVPDEYLDFPNILNAVKAGLIEIVSFDSDDESIVINAELAGIGGSGVAGTKFLLLDIHGGVDTALVKVVDDVPFMVFKRNANERSIWTVTMPSDYQAGTDAFVEIFWSPKNSNAGVVRWLLEYKSVASGETLAGPSGTSTFDQSASGSNAVLQTTSSTLSIPAAALAANDMINVSVNRLGSNVADTYAGTARVHLVRIGYTGLVFS